MEKLTWQSVVIFLGLLAVITIMFCLTDDQQLQERILDYIDLIVAFVIGGAVGGSIGYIRGFSKGRSGS